MKNILVYSKTFTKWGAKRPELVTIYTRGPRFVCKEGKDGEEGVLGFGSTETEAIENYIWRKHYFDGGREKYIPAITIDEEGNYDQTS